MICHLINNAVPMPLVISFIFMYLFIYLQQVIASVKISLPQGQEEVFFFFVNCLNIQSKVSWLVKIFMGNNELPLASVLILDPAKNDSKKIIFPSEKLLTWLQMFYPIAVILNFICACFSISHFNCVA